MKVNLNELICELYMHKFGIILALFYNFVPLYKGVKPLKFPLKKKKTIKMWALGQGLELAHPFSYCVPIISIHCVQFYHPALTRKH